MDAVPAILPLHEGRRGGGCEERDRAELAVKVFKSRRSWAAKVQEQIPDRRIVWTSEGAKGSTRGAVTFHPLADDLTRILLVIEYYPSGFMEKTGNLWRAGGRRARLDLKNFRRHITMQGEARAVRGEG
ncbi:SRPBCC family protein [Frankia sp. QA3]|uniref:SRPBCC family protein n=1 Tax=Frankia sp. QA3 TaxID=710111 RepID=UPI001E4120C5|nr:SRPBCC family protein [Frankia sp. QA3]